MSTKLKQPYAAIVKDVSTNENDITDNPMDENININNNGYNPNLEEDKNEENELSEYNDDENGAEMLNEGQYMDYTENENGEENEIYENENENTNNENMYEENENNINNDQNAINYSAQESLNEQNQNELNNDNNNEITDNSLSQQNNGMNSISLEQMAVLEKLKIKIMEKDKIIFKNRQKEQELNLNIEKLNSELKSQKLINDNLNSKIQILEQRIFCSIRFIRKESRRK